jgi:hypothetical protein
MKKIFREETFDDSDWNDVAHLTFIGLSWLYENTDCKITPETNQVHLQAKASSSQQRRRRKK